MRAQSILQIEKNLQNFCFIPLENMSFSFVAGFFCGAGVGGFIGFAAGLTAGIVAGNLIGSHAVAGIVALTLEPPENSTWHKAVLRIRDGQKSAVNDSLLSRFITDEKERKRLIRNIRAIPRTLQSDSKLFVFQGPAGTGKSFFIEAFTKALRQYTNGGQSVRNHLAFSLDSALAAKVAHEQQTTENLVKYCYVYEMENGETTTSSDRVETFTFEESANKRKDVSAKDLQACLVAIMERVDLR